MLQIHVLQPLINASWWPQAVAGLMHVVYCKRPCTALLLILLTDFFGMEVVHVLFSMMTFSSQG